MRKSIILSNWKFKSGQGTKAEQSGERPCPCALCALCLSLPAPQAWMAWSPCPGCSVISAMVKQPDRLKGLVISAEDKNRM